MVPKWFQNGSKMVPKLSQNSSKIVPKMVLKWSQNVSKLMPNGPKTVPKWFQNGSKLVLKLSQNSPKIFQVIDLEVINLNSEFEPCSSLNGWDKLLVQFLATMEAVAPLANDPIMLGRPIWSFRDLELQNPSIISEDTDRNRWLPKKFKKSKNPKKKSKKSKIGTKDILGAEGPE